MHKPSVRVAVVKHDQNKDKRDRERARGELDNSEKARGKNAPPYLTEGVVLGRERFRVDAMIGGGGFGQIYTATCKHQPGEVFAVKVEPQTNDARMLLEIKVLEELNNINSRYAPKIICSGSINNCNYIVMQKLQQNLSEIRKSLPKRRFSLMSTIRIAHQLIDALKDLHSIGYVHRDVKPSNACPGLGPNSKTIYLIDFGMSRRFRHRETGAWFPERCYAAFRGTVRYASLGVHERLEQGPVDDFWSLYYTLIELAEGELPWRKLSDNDEICYMKLYCTFRELCPSFPRQFHKFAQVLNETEREEDVDYDELHEILESCMPASYDRTADFEWEMGVNVSAL